MRELASEGERFARLRCLRRGNRARALRATGSQVRKARRRTWASSIIDGEALPDFIDPLFERIEPCMKSAVVEVEDISECKQSEDPMVALDVNQNPFDRVTDESNDTQQNVHRVFPPETMTLLAE
jgi:hypothetical protein